jgi:hypothetical protein
VAELTGQPRTGRSAAATLRVESPSRKRQDHAIDVFGAPYIGPHYLERAEGPGARHRQLDVAELRQQPAEIAAVALRLADLRHALEVFVDQLVHAAFEQLGERVAGTGPIILVPFDAFRLHSLHHPKRGW